VIKKRFLLIWGLFFIIGITSMGCGHSVSKGNSYSGLSISPRTATLSIGATQKFTVDGLLKSSSTDTCAINWVVVGNIGTVDATGNFMATAEGAGAVEVRSDLLVGRADITVTNSGQIKTIIGKVINIYGSGEGVASATVIASNRITTSGADGAYSLIGVPASAEIVSAAAPGFFPVSIALSSEATNIPMGFVGEGGTYATPINSLIIGKITDSTGNPITSTTSGLWFATILENSGSFGVPTITPSGDFFKQVAVPLNKPTQGYIFVGYTDGAVNRSAVKPITITGGTSLDAGTIVVSEPVANLNGTISLPSGYYISHIDYGVVFSPSKRISISGSGIIGNTYSFKVPANPPGIKYYVEIDAVKGNDYTYLYLDDLTVTSGQTLNNNIVFPPGIEMISPTSGQIGLSVSPKFEWTSAGNDYSYVVMVGDENWIKWWGLTNKTSMEYPSFPIGNGGEAANLRPSGNYFVAVSAFKNVDIYNLKGVTDFATADVEIYHSAVSFSTGGVSGSGVRAADISGSEKFNKLAKEFMKKMGLSGK